ncbi:hypothetical protein GCM10023153_25160 [Ornithinibacter aureus]|uniref:DUF4192 family protein n=1 Tax=Ornithinibacter aureus TaxID=622664 RepID=A0ABP8K263_9MICO|nr:DUF4192 domain-containing protein [Ornithinibacter aureus]KAF0833126.1 uncharacterized protein DUF4192 [Ornithinibacter aureus]
MTPDITLRGPGDIVSVLPYHLGYHPRDSVVVVSIRGRLLGLVARVDIPPPGREAEVATWLTGPMVRDGASAAIVVSFEDRVDASVPLSLAVADHLEQVGVDVLDVLVVRDGRRYSPRCDQDCCPAEGIALPDPADVVGVAEYVARGRAPLLSRSAVDDLVRADPVASTGVAAAIGAREGMPRRRLRRRSARAWAEVLRRPPTDGMARDGGGQRPSPTVVADLALGLHDIAWRDAVIAWLAPGVLPLADLHRGAVLLLESTMPSWGGMGFDGEPGEGSDEVLRRLVSLCRSLPDEAAQEAAAVCTVVAHVAWASGDGTIARAAIERAQLLAPDYRLAALLAKLIDGGIRFPAITTTEGVTQGGDDRLGRAG